MVEKVISGDKIQVLYTDFGNVSDLLHASEYWHPYQTLTCSGTCVCGHIGVTLLYYTIFGTICSAMFWRHLNWQLCLQGMAGKYMYTFMS